MPHFDPATRFWIGIIVTVAIGVSGGALNLTHAIPSDWIAAVTAWCSIIAFVGSAITTSLSGLGMTTQSRLASAAAVPEVKSIVTTQAIAEATPSDKVVGLSTGTKA